MDYRMQQRISGYNGAILQSRKDLYRIEDHKLTMNFFDIVKDESLRKRFPQNTFPKIEVMSDGAIFAETTKRVLEPGHDTFIKWLIADSNGVVVHDWDYPYTRLRDTGYLLKIIVPITSSKSKQLQFHVEYAVDLNEMPIIQQSELLKHGEDSDQVDIEAQSFLGVEPYNMSSKVGALFNPIVTSPDFFNKYLKDYMYDITDE